MCEFSSDFHAKSLAFYHIVQSFWMCKKFKKWFVSVCGIVTEIQKKWKEEFSQILKLDKKLKFSKIRGKQTNYGFEN